MNKELMTGENEDGQDEEILITETPPAPVEDDDDDEEGGHGSEGSEDRRVKRTDGDSGEETPEQIRERRREEKRQRRERREAAIRRNNLEMDFLRKRNDDLERKLNGVAQQVGAQQQHTIDEAIAKVDRDMRLAEDVLAKAIAASNGEDAAKTLKIRDALSQRKSELAYAKMMQSQQAQQPEQRGEQQAQVPNEVLRQAKKFVDENKWYDPSGGNEESAIMLAIDAQLVREGFDPSDPDYWTELRRRGERRLPDKFKRKASREVDADDDDDDAPVQRKPRGGPPVGSGRERPATGTGRREIYISPERKQALIEAGVWDDPVLRSKYVKKYAEYDKNNRR